MSESVPTGDRNKMAVLDYARANPRGLWPVGASIAVLIIAFLLQSVLLPCLCARGTTKVEIALLLDGLFVARVVIARLLGETNRSYIFYFIVLLSSPLWIELIAEGL